ncbi:MAG TPA: hypothetical protein VEX86_19475, partial [Longimicrobium sp.]|nr:hypothetical protein [Longimicrobium sp.]
ASDHPAAVDRCTAAGSPAVPIRSVPSRRERLTALRQEGTFAFRASDPGISYRFQGIVLVPAWPVLSYHFG